MKEIINWLIEIEKKAHKIFSETALMCEDDEKLSRFFNKLADDEAIHYHIMNSAKNHIRIDEPVSNNEIVLDDQTKANVEKPLENIERIISKNDFIKIEIVDQIIESELSEWNDIFIYVINSLKSEFIEFRQSVPKIQNHLRYIENFCEHNEDCKQSLDKIKTIPNIWEEQILIVEDFEPLRELFKDILSKYGQVDTAENGEVAREKAFSKYYSFILTDIDMPKLNGMDFYNKLIEKHPQAKHRVAFMSGDVSPQRKKFFKENGLVYKEKPVSVSEIKELVLKSFGI